MLNADKLIEWSDEAARSEDFVIAQLLLYPVKLRNLSDERTIEILRNFARMRATDSVATCRAREITETPVDEWPEFVEG